MTSSPQQEPRLYHARIAGIDDVLPDTRILHVELAHHQRLAFYPGQYALLGVAGMESRPFSIASLPAAPVLEFHIRNIGQGISAALCQLQPGATLTVEAPLGRSHWRSAAAPVIALAGGLGIAPVKAIVEAHLSTPGTAPCHLYWGVRDATQLYLDTLFRLWAQKYPRFSYIPVLSDEKDHPRLRCGFVSAALCEDMADLSGFDIYLAGPPPMVAATLPALLHQGAEKDRIFSDVWAP